MRRTLWIGLLTAVASSAAVSWWPADDAALVVGPAPDTDRGETAGAPRIPAIDGVPPPDPAPASAAGASAATVALGERHAAWPPLRAAARSAWLPPPLPRAPPPVVDDRPPPAPAFPYHWLGQIEEDGQTRLFLAGPQRTWVVATGDVLDRRWRVDGVADGRLQLTWLATGESVAVAAR